MNDACFIVCNTNGQALGYFSSAVQKVPFSVSRGSPERGLLTRATEIIAMKLIDVVPAARVIIAATICVMAGSANAQQIGSVQEGRQLAREVCAECHAIDNAADGSTNPNAPTFKVIANTPGMTSAALTVALQTTHRILIIDLAKISAFPYVLSAAAGPTNPHTRFVTGGSVFRASCQQ
jgi:hypothetical protein